MMDQWNDAEHADGSDMATDDQAARALAQDHPKSAVPPPHSPGMALDGSSTSEGTDSATGQPGIGVGGAIPIGALQS
jgi:hypothetical protein